ncbi:MAG TPA: hypothetical protein EYQ66_14100 [Myxococcales bacterium]|nr:hypothetical protein [Myxococcales bacterium]
MRRASLRWASLRWASLRWASLRWASLSWASLSWASLSWASLSWTVDWVRRQPGRKAFQKRWQPAANNHARPSAPSPNRYRPATDPFA